MARLLKPLGIAPEQIRFATNDSRKGYWLHHFKEAFERYLPPERGSEPKLRNKSDEMGSSATSQTETAEPFVSDEKSEKPNNDGQSFGVSVAKGGNGANVCAQCKAPPDGDERLCLVDGAEVWLHEQCERFYREDSGWRSNP